MPVCLRLGMGPWLANSFSRVCSDATDYIGFRNLGSTSMYLVFHFLAFHFYENLNLPVSNYGIS